MSMSKKKKTTHRYTCKCIFKNQPTKKRNTFNQPEIPRNDRPILVQHFTCVWIRGSCHNSRCHVSPSYICSPAEKIFAQLPRLVSVIICTSTLKEELNNNTLGEREGWRVGVGKTERETERVRENRWKEKWAVDTMRMEASMTELNFAFMSDTVDFIVSDTLFERG